MSTQVIVHNKSHASARSINDACAQFYEDYVATFIHLVLNSPLSGFNDAEPLLRAIRNYDQGLDILVDRPDFTRRARSLAFIGLIDVFNASPDLTAARVRVPGPEDERKYVIPLDAEIRKMGGENTIVESMEQFKSNWTAFSFGYLRHLTDWSNIVVAGGAIQACLMSVAYEHRQSDYALESYYRRPSLADSDIDIFVWGIEKENFYQVERRVTRALCVGQQFMKSHSTHAITFSGNSYLRDIQLIKFVFRSPADIIKQFDIDVVHCLYDGSRVYMSPHSISASIRQAITVDTPVVSFHYETRLLKYALRGFEIWVPELRRESINPMIYDQPVISLTGLAFLIAAERLIAKKRTTQSKVSLVRALNEHGNVVRYNALALKRQELDNCDPEDNSEGDISVSRAREIEEEYISLLAARPIGIGEWCQSAYIREV